MELVGFLAVLRGAAAESLQEHPGVVAVEGSRFTSVDNDNRSVIKHSLFSPKLQSISEAEVYQDLGFGISQPAVARFSNPNDECLASYK